MWNKIFKTGSLHSRLNAITIVLAIALSLFSYNVYLNQLDTKSTVDRNSKDRELLIKFKSRINSEILKSYKYLDSFLLDPSNNIYKEWINDSIDHAIENNQALIQSKWGEDKKLNRLLDNLQFSLVRLKKEVDVLIEVRRDSNSQYPSLQIASSKMRPNRVRFFTALAVALNEVSLNNYQDNPEQRKIYDEIIKTRYLWSLVISNFRIYLANQFGTFDHENLLRQEEGIEEQHALLSRQLKVLSDLSNTGVLGFETSEVIPVMIKASNEWLDAFLEVKEIHHSPLWRADLNILKNQIQPILDDISYVIALIDEEYKSTFDKDISLINSIINNQLNLLIIISFIVISFLLLLVLLIKRFILNPIKMVTGAIKQESKGGDIAELPIVKTTETRDLVEAFAEMHKQIHIRQSELEYQASHDSLTGLPNRKYFLEHLDLQLERFPDKSCAILLIDLNGFKDINDTLGHHVGDKILINVGNRLWSVFRESDVIARLGGDEYAILLKDVDKDATITILQKIQSKIDLNFDLEGVKTSVSMSIGAALYPQHGSSSNVLLRHADVAMYTAKKQKHTYVFYKASEDTYSLNKLSLSHDLKNSITSNGLMIYFQPRVSLIDTSVIGAEALIRWKHSKMGIIPPNEFIPMAEQTGFINKITYWLIEEALITIQKWKKQKRNITLSLNLSVYNLYHVSFVENVSRLLNEYPGCANKIIFEITESAMMSNPMAAISVLQEISVMGIRFSIDDYGTGFSSLSYLTQLAVNELKIDKSFVMDMMNDERKRVIVRSTVEMAHNLNLNVVAEGVENEETMIELESMGCDYAQGFHLSRPIPEDEFINWLDRYNQMKKGQSN